MIRIRKTAVIAIVLMCATANSKSMYRLRQMSQDMENQALAESSDRLMPAAAAEIDEQQEKERDAVASLLREQQRRLQECDHHISGYKSVGISDAEKNAWIVRKNRIEQPVCYAIMCRNVDVVKTLLARGADVNRLTLEVGIANHQVRIVHLLLKALKPTDIDINQPNSDGETLLHHAVECAHIGHDGIIMLLLSAGADPSIRDNNGRTPLDLADFLGNEAVSCLLSKSNTVRLLISSNIDIESFDKPLRPQPLRNLF